MTRDALREALESWRAQGTPVDEERRERLRESTIDRIRGAMHGAAEVRRRRSWVLGALMAALIGVAAAAAVIVTSSLLERSSGAVAVVAEAEVTARGVGEVRRAGVPVPLREGAVALVAGDSLRAEAAVELSLPDAGRGSLDADGVLDVTRALHAEQHFFLHRGKLAIAIPPESPHRDLTVNTAQAVVSVVGTEFDVRVSGEASVGVTEVTVRRGRVHVRARDGQDVWLGPGDRWRSSSARAPAPPDADASAGPVTPPAVPTNAPPPSPRSTLPEQNRLFRAALDARNAGDDARAVTLLDTLITRFPASPLRQEAEVERFRALQRIGQSGEATRAARRYLSEYATGFARDEAERLALPSARPPAAPTE